MRGKKFLQVAKNRYSGDLGIVPLDFDKDSLSYQAKKKNKIKLEDSEKVLDEEYAVPEQNYIDFNEKPPRRGMPSRKFKKQSDNKEIDSFLNDILNLK